MDILRKDQNRFYTILWHGSYKYMLVEHGDITSYFMHRICYRMSSDEQAQVKYQGELAEEDAVYYVQNQNSCAFRPFQVSKPNSDWAEKICKKILS